MADEPRRPHSDGRGGGDASAPDSSELFEAARSYARRGWAVLPLKPRGKEPLTEHGVKDATTDLDTIEEWWRRWPKANVGIATGAVSGLVVLDIDPRNGGDEELEGLLAQHGGWGVPTDGGYPETWTVLTGGGYPETWTVLTGGGGQHYYFAIDGPVPSRQLAKGVDLKGDGGYVVAPPSVHQSGRKYVPEASTENLSPAPAPAWLLGAAGARKAPLYQEQDGQPVREGQRNAYLASLAGKLRRMGLSQAGIEAELLAINAARCVPPLPEAEVRRIAASIARYEPGRFVVAAWGEGGERPRVQVNDRHMRDIRADAAAALAAANNPPTLFLRGGKLVRVSGSAPLAELLTVPELQTLLDQAADFVTVRVDDSGAERCRPARPPRDICDSLLAMPPDGVFPRLASIRSAPVYDASGRLLAREGYDPESGLLLRLGGLEGVRDDLPATDARALLLDELLGDFPFVDDAGRAHAAALLIEPFVRELISGPTPLYLIDAPVRGTGKSLLAAVCCLVATGREPHVMTLVRSDVEEHEKRITALLLAGAPWVLLDNVDTLASAPLAAVLTTTRWRGRRLGKSEMVDVPNDATWVATGNNVELSDEIARRTVPIRLDPEVERPEERNGFRHPALAEWVREHRAELISACVSLVRAWVDAGRPKGRAALGSYERWAEVVGGIVEVAGIPGFLDGREWLYSAADRLGDEWRALCEAWWETYKGHSVSARDVFAIAKERSLLLDLWGGRSALGAQQRIGHALARMRDRVVSGYRIRATGRHPETGSAAYNLEPARARNETGGRLKTMEIPETPNRTGTNGGVSGVFGVFHRPPAPHHAGGEG